MVNYFYNLDSTIKINYTTLYVVKESEKNLTEFVCVIQKRSEEKIDGN